MIRPAREDDLPAIVAIYNHFVRETPITFDLVETTLDQRRTWFDQFSDGGRHQLLVAEKEARLVGYAHSSAFRPKPAYRRSVETTIYVRPESGGQGVGTRLLAELLRRLEVERVHRAYATITLPNPSSVRLHEKFGFRDLMTLSEVGHKFGRYWDTLWMERQF